MHGLIYWTFYNYYRIYEVTHVKKFLSISRKIFDWIWKNGWDTSVCGGGVWFDNSLGGKQTIENVQMIQLGNKLARLTKENSYRDRAALVWKWVQKVGILNMTSFQVCISYFEQPLCAKPNLFIRVDIERFNKHFSRPWS